MAEPVLTRIKDWLGHPCYSVSLDGEIIGKVFGFNPTFDRAPRGVRYVTKRWTSRRRYWAAEDAGRKTNPYSVPYDTRKQAVASLVAFHSRQIAEPEREA